jgi:phenylpropionate dioxygenase-like ring-hydroxylating dioxygenase large terminal subunit
VGDQPHGVTMFGKRFVVVRDDSGAPTVMNAACPHRGAPLDQGWVSTVQDRTCITCPYHGCAISSSR